MRSPATSIFASANSRLLPAGSRLALDWRDPELGEHFLAEPPSPVDLLSRLELASAEAGLPAVAADTLSLAWEDGAGARLSVLARLASPLGDGACEAWMATARTLLDSALEATRAQARADRLEQSRRLQQALYEIAELAGAEVEMSGMLRRLHGIIAALMYAPNCYLVTCDEDLRSVRFIYFADQVDTYVPAEEEEWTERELPSSLTFGLLRHGQALRVRPVADDCRHLGAKCLAPVVTLRGAHDGSHVGAAA